MRPGDVVPVADFQARLTEAERDALHYLTHHCARLALPTLTLPAVDGDQAELLTEREREALAAFYAREAETAATSKAQAVADKLYEHFRKGQIR